MQNVRTENGKNIFIDASVLNRQPGSALKPFFYGLALEKKLITFNDFVLDAPLFINLSNNRIYAPQNYSRSYSGLVSAEEALGLSLNTPAVRVSQLLNEKDIKAVLINSGIESFKNLSEVGPSFVLGTPPVSLMELTKAYSNLFSGQVFSKTTTEELFRVLSNENLRGFNLSGNPLLSFPKALAIKTGTSNNDRDSWTFASNKKLTVGIWTGNADGTVPENIGPNNSALILRSIYLNSALIN